MLFSFELYSQEYSSHMNYQEVLDYMYAQLPMFHRVGPAAYKPGLDNTYALLEIVGNPHLGLKCVHIAGTNGKGSTSHLIASSLQEAGYKIGLYTSPHLKDFRERMKINGAMISEADVTAFVNLFARQWEKIQPSFFEINVAMCFWFFSKEKTDIAVIETGLGGRLDSTNVITPEVSVITNIGMDHMNLLGDTIEQIAFEKAGIIKQNIPIVIGTMRSDAREIMKQKAHDCKAHLYDSSLRDLADIPDSELKGMYQIENRKTAFVTLQTLISQGYSITKQNIENGFERVVMNTGLMGRWQVLGENPLVIADVAHNEDGLNYVLRQLENTPHDHLHFVIGLVADKDVDRVLKLLPTSATYYFCKADIPRGLDSVLLATRAATFNLTGESFASVKSAFENAKRKAQKNDLVFIGGSVFTVAEVL